MRQAQLANYTNPYNSFNLPYVSACVVARRINEARLARALRGLWGVRVVNVLAVPIDKSILPDDPFTPEMFLPGGTLFDTPLNQYLVVQWRGRTGMVNAGALATRMLFGVPTALKLLKDLFKKNAPTATTQNQNPDPSEATSEV